MSEPAWLTWTRELQAIAQTGLAFTRDEYDRQRYDALRALAARIMAAHASGIDAARIDALFAAERGYATPKLGVRAAAFDPEGRILMVREVVDGGRWTLPGGWADVNFTPAENAIKEVREETGFLVRVEKLAAIWDHARQGHPPAPFAVVQHFFVCTIVGGAATTSLETGEAAFFSEDALPDDLSLPRVLPRQVRRMFEHWRDPGLATDWE